MHGILKRSTGQISIITPVDITNREEFYNHLRDLSTSHNNDITLCNKLGNIVGIEIIDQDDLSTFDRYFRDAWELADYSQVIVNIEKAKEIHIDKLRVVRDEKLTELDVEFQRALEVSDDAVKSEVIAKKQELRDMPENIDFSSATTPEKIKEVIPACLQ